MYWYTARPQFERNELDCAFLTIDADQDGFISFTEMEEWWGHDI